ncbi:hypothetical protein F4806DRAFT_499567 [Annulohypoxylon nitens]|nr:hypothetical protein F4806DRAFT_499567 [Annulohypoxylon nitens]
MPDTSRRKVPDSHFDLVLNLGKSFYLRFKTSVHVKSLIDQIQDLSIELDFREKVLSVTFEATITSVLFGQGYSEIYFEREADAKKLHENLSSVFFYHEGHPNMLRFNNIHSQCSKKKKLQSILKSGIGRFRIHIRKSKDIGIGIQTAMTPRIGTTGWPAELRVESAESAEAESGDNTGSVMESPRRYASPGCDCEINNEIDLGVHLAKVHQETAEQRGVQQRIAVDDMRHDGAGERPDDAEIHDVASGGVRGVESEDDGNEDAEYLLEPSV